MLSLECYLEAAVLQPKPLKFKNLNINNYKVPQYNILVLVLLHLKNFKHASRLQEVRVQLPVKVISKRCNNVRHKTRITINLHEIFMIFNYHL